MEKLVPLSVRLTQRWPTQCLSHSVFVPLSVSLTQCCPIKSKREYFAHFFNPLLCLLTFLSVNIYLELKFPLGMVWPHYLYKKNSDKMNAFFVCAILAIGKILLLFCFFGWWQNFVLCQTFSLADDKILSYAKIFLWLMTKFCLMPNFCCSTMSMPNFCLMPNLRGRYPTIAINAKLLVI